MTPAKKKATNLKAKNASRNAVVDTEDSRVLIDWPANCGGGVREFNAGDLRAHIDTVERLASLGDDLWYEAEDSTGRGFVCRLADGRLHAHEAWRMDMPHVSWAQFKRAMEARIK